MFLSKKILIALILMGSVNAAVITIRSPQRRDVQSCHATNHGLFNSYNVWVGVSFGSQSCDNTYNWLEYGDDPRDIDNGCEISSWKCEEAGDGNTQLYFNSGINLSGCINSALEQAYPTVSTFNCPGH